MTVTSLDRTPRRPGNSGEPRDSLRVPDGVGWDKIGPYVKLAHVPLGHGSQGDVFLAVDPRNGGKVAIKWLLDAATIPGEEVDRIVTEGARIAKTLHPGLCGIIDAGHHAGRPYLVMPFIPGRTLAEHIARSRQWIGDPRRRSAVRLDLGAAPTSAHDDADLAGSRIFDERRRLAMVVAMIRDLARALQSAHDEGIVHRDIKPGNIMIAPEGRAVLLDFGLAREHSEGSIAHSRELLGTLAYLSPEQVTAGRTTVDRRSDIYSLGVTLYECLVLRRPYEFDTPREILTAIDEARADEVRRWNRRIPRDLSRIVATAMQRNPSRRFADAAALADALEAVDFDKTVQFSFDALRDLVWPRRTHRHP